MDLTLFEPIVSSSTAHSIRHKLLALIEGKRLVVGDRLPAERDLAVAFRVSRTTLRDALRSLEGYGVLEARHGAGWFVKLDSPPIVHEMGVRFQLSDEALIQMVEARLELEPAIAAHAAARRTADDLAALVQLVEQLEATTDPSIYVKLDSKFHLQLGECSHNPFLQIAVRPILDVMEESRRGMNQHLSTRASIEEHRRILGAVQRGDAHAARSAMTRHLRSFQRRTMALYASAL